MKTTPKHNERIAKMTFASVYPHYITKVEKKDRTIEELHQVIEWLTGYNESDLNLLKKKQLLKPSLKKLILILMPTSSKV